MATVAIYDEYLTRVGEAQRGEPHLFRVEYLVAGETKWATNGVVFRERRAAEGEARRRAAAWTAVLDWRVVTDDTPLRAAYHPDGEADDDSVRPLLLNDE